jgi:copper(I)-binding protein
MRSRIIMLRQLFALLAASSLVAAAHAHQYSVGNLVIGHPWSRPTASGMPTGVAYLSITNNGTRQDTLVSASTPAAARVEFHRSSLESGMARMRPTGELIVAPNTTLTAEPGGLHLMLVDLKAPLVAGSSIPLLLQFKSAGLITVQLKVEPQSPAAPH